LESDAADPIETEASLLSDAAVVPSVASGDAENNEAATELISLKLSSSANEIVPIAGKELDISSLMIFAAIKSRWFIFIVNGIIKISKAGSVNLDPSAPSMTRIGMLDTAVDARNDYLSMSNFCFLFDEETIAALLLLGYGADDVAAMFHHHRGQMLAP
jgi:hypothetical protein